MNGTNNIEFAHLKFSSQPGLSKTCREISGNIKKYILMIPVLAKIKFATRNYFIAKIMHTESSPLTSFLFFFLTQHIQHNIFVF